MAEVADELGVIEQTARWRVGRKALIVHVFQFSVACVRIRLEELECG